MLEFKKLPDTPAFVGERKESGFEVELMKKCPFCAEEIQDAAIKCRHCGELLGSAAPESDKPLPSTPKSPRADASPAASARPDSPSEDSIVFKIIGYAGLAIAMSGVLCFLFMIPDLISFFGGPQGTYHGACTNSLAGKPASPKPSQFEADIVITKLEKGDYSIKVGADPAAVVRKSGNMLIGGPEAGALQIDFDATYKKLKLNAGSLACEASRNAKP